MSKVNLDPALCERAGSWIHTAWRTLPPRHEGLFWNTAGERAIQANLQTHEVYKKSYSGAFSIRDSAKNFHKLCEGGDFWGKDHKNFFWEESSNHILNLSALVIAGNIAFNTNQTKDVVKLPERTRKDFHLYGLDSLEYKVRWCIEGAWRARQPSGYSKHDALEWERTTECALDAVYATIRSLDDANDITTLKTICRLTHENMMKNWLWGRDNNNPDRAYPDGRPLMFVDLSPEMQENYVLIALATLNGISDFQAKQVLGKDPYLSLIEAK